MSTNIIKIGSGQLSPGHYQTFNQLFSGGLQYNVVVTPKQKEEEFHVRLYNEIGQKVADDLGNYGPQCYISITSGEPLKIKVAVFRDVTPTSSSKDKVDYSVVAFTSPLRF